MDSIENADKVTFIKHMTELNAGDKATMMNMVQYALLAIVPIVIVLKVIKMFVPEEDEEKGSMEILAESLGQIVAIVLSVWIINRIIVFIPTYSGVDYKPMDHTSFLLGFLIVLMTMQTKLGEKINILIERLMALWNGDSSLKKEDGKKGGNVVRVTQPISGGHIPSRPDILSPSQMTSLHSQTTEKQLPQHDPRSGQSVHQSQPDFNQMYQNSVTPLVDAQSPGAMEPMAANEAMGGGMFGGSSF